jgi:aspartate aminotransferase-like enzyme
MPFVRSQGCEIYYERHGAGPALLLLHGAAQIETFRVGCIGAIGRNEMQQAVHAVAETLREMGIADGAPAL